MMWLKRIKDWILAPAKVGTTAGDVAVKSIFTVATLYVALRAFLLAVGCYVGLGLVNVVLWAVPQLMGPIRDLFVLSDTQVLIDIADSISTFCTVAFGYTNKLFGYLWPLASEVFRWLVERFNDFLNWIDSL